MEQALRVYASNALPATPETLAAAEIAAGLIGRSFALADGAPDAITPHELNHIGRQLVRTGESLHVIEVSRDGRIECLPCESFYVDSGGPQRSSWRYYATLQAPSGGVSRYVPSDAVIWIPWGTDNSAPWRGIGPLEGSALSAALTASVERQMSAEASGPVGNVIPVPKAGADGKETENLRDTIAQLDGRVMLAETTASGWSEGKQGAPQTDWQPRRLGADYPAGVVEARRDMAAQVLAACGVPPELVWPQGSAGAREALRRFLHLTIQPLGNIISAELTYKLDKPVNLTFERLMASDIAGRARAFGSLVKGGYSAQEAAAVVLLPVPAEADTTEPTESAQRAQEVVDATPEPDGAGVG